jgi:hypothetical protein
MFLAFPPKNALIHNFHDLTMPLLMQTVSLRPS